MRSNTPANPYDSDIGSLWGAVRRGLPLLLMATIGAGVVTFTLLSTMASRYTSETQLVMAAIFLLSIALIVIRALLRGSRAASGAALSTRALPSLAAVAEPALSRVVAPRAGAAAAAAPVIALPAKPAVTETAALTSIDTLASRLLKASVTQSGFRTMVAPEGRLVDATAEATALVGGLASAGKQVVLVDWNLDGTGCAEAVGVTRKPGITDLLQGGASFEDAIAQLPGSEAHFIAGGDALTDRAMAEDADRLNLVLDALDEAYDHIVVVASFDAARLLFEVIEGRFDAGVTVCEPRRQRPSIEQAAGRFLGFEVSDLDIICFERPAAASATAPARAVGAARP